MKNKKILDKYKIMLRNEGLKITPQRIVVLEEIIKDKGHRESEDIYLALKNHNTHVSRATVYRTLDILVQNNFVRQMNLGDGRARYECKINGHHHDHMICNKCGKIIEFVNADIERLQDKVAKKFEFIMTRHIHQLFGICKQCQ